MHLWCRSYRRWQRHISLHVNHVLDWLNTTSSRWYSFHTVFGCQTWSWRTLRGPIQQGLNFRLGNWRVCFSVLQNTTEHYCKGSHSISLRCFWLLCAAWPCISMQWSLAAMILFWKFPILKGLWLLWSYFERSLAAMILFWKVSGWYDPIMKGIWLLWS
jgi:hypothetical protein